MTDTGWKLPKTVSQDVSKDINPGKEYSFVHLDNIKKDDDTYCDISPWSITGIDLDHKSPYLYTYNYSFNLPKNATVNKITTYIRLQQITHPKYKYDPKGKYRYSISKFLSVKLKQGASTVGEGTGTNFASKCGSQMLPYKKWSTEEQTTFSGTPAEWGITSKDVISIINSGNFGMVFQFVGTVDDGWCNPAIAYVKMKIDYTVPGLATKLSASEFTKVEVECNGNLVVFSNNTSPILGSLEYNDFVHPILVNFKFYHKGLAGETPVIVFESDSLIMGANANAYINKKTSIGKYTMPSLHTNGDNVERVYSQTIAVFPGIMMGEQTIRYTLNNTKYTLKFNVVNGALSEEDRLKFINQNQKCYIKNCLFYNNHALGLGGANCITSEFYIGQGNRFGTGTNANKADNKYNENNGQACNDTCWLGVCKSGNNGG